MRARIRILCLFVTASGVAAGSLLGGCGSVPSERPSYDLASEAGASASLPDAAANDAAPKDAGDTRPKFDPADEPVTCTGTPCAVELVAGDHHFCARMSDGTVRCWGSDEYGALGAGGPTKDPGPVDPPPKGGDTTSDAGADAGAASKDAGVDAGPPSAAKVVVGLTDAKQLSAAGQTTCALRKDGSVWCWGRNSTGQLGLAEKPTWDEAPHPNATAVALRSPATRIDVGPMSACAVLVNGEVWCWGNNEKEQLARPEADAVYVLGPAKASMGQNDVARTAMGTNTGFGVTTAGYVVSWGAVAGKDGMVCGRMSSISPDPEPNTLTKLTAVSSLAVTPTFMKGEGGPIALPSDGTTKPLGPFPPPPIERHAHACAIAFGEVYCWGKSDTGALCTGLPDAELLPAPAPVKSPKAWPQQVAVGDEISCVRLTDGTIQCCGGDAKGRLGPGHPDPFVPFFEPVTSYTSHAVHVATSMRSVCALAQGGTVECWGSNELGELGTLTPDEDSHPAPVKVAF